MLGCGGENVLTRARKNLYAPVRRERQLKLPFISLFAVNMVRTRNTMSQAALLRPNPA